MTDGPHRSLPMTRAWKKVAEAADKPAFPLEDIVAATIQALGRDWRAGVPDAVVTKVARVLSDPQGHLFAEDGVPELEAARELASGHVLAGIFVNCAARRVGPGAWGPERVRDAASEALSLWALRHPRQVEEHYCRKVDGQRARRVGRRIEQGIAAADLRALASSLLGSARNPFPRATPKHTGLDEGVRL